jgi:hypothetical protein
MVLLITCRYLEVADRRMTTTITLVLAQAFVAGAPSLVHQLVSHGVLHRRPFPERGPSTPRLPLGTQLLLKRLIHVEAHTSPLSVGGFGALGAHNTYVHLITYVDVPPESMRAALADLGFPAWQAAGLLEEFAMYRRGEAAGVEPGVRDALGQPPRSFDEFARDYAPLFA